MNDLEMNVPTLRFPGFEDEWELKKLGEVFTFRSTNSYSRENLNYNEGKVKNIHYGDIHTQFKTMFDITKERVPFINADIPIEKISKDNYCKEGDLIIADASEDYADIGKSIEIVNLNNEDVLAGLHTLQARPDLLPMQVGFSGYLMQSERVRLQIKTIAQGTKVLGISASRLNNIELYLPSLPEQNKIASFLSAVDEKLQQLKQEKAHLTQYKKGVMQRIFCRNHGFEGFKDDTDVDESGERKSEKSFNPSNLRFRQDDGSAFPEWEEKSLGEVMSIPEKVKPARIEKEKLLTVRLHLKGIFKNENTDSLLIGSTNYFVRNAGQFIYGKQNLFNGAFGIIPKEFDGYLSSSDVPALDIDYSKVNGQFIFYYLSRYSFYKSLEEIASGSGSKRIHENTFLNVDIIMPTLPEQIKIANFLSAIDDKITNITNQITLTEQWKKGLLQKMFV